MKILFQDGLEQFKKVRRIVKNLEEAEKLAECLNHWNDDDSWGGTFGLNKWTAEQINTDWFNNMKIIEQLIVDDGGIFQGYISFDYHLEDEDAVYVPLLGVSPTAQGKGYGKALLLSILRKSIELNKRRLELDTWAGNLRSVPVYKKTGFFWRKNTSAVMENYLPAILTTQYFEDFFIKNDFYNSRELEVTQKHDDFTHETMQAYFYSFVENKSNSLKVYVDSYAKDISGFSHIKDGKNLSIQLIPNQHEIYLGLVDPIVELQVINERDFPVSIRGNISGYKEIKDISTKKVNFIVGPKEHKSIKINISIDSSSETFIPKHETRKRTKCRISAYLEVDGKKCQLGCGWVPKDVFQVILLKRSLYFGKNTKEVIVPLGFRNLTQETINGNLSISGEGLSNPHISSFDLGADSAIEVLLPIKKPENPVSKSWEWELKFKILKNSDFQTLPPFTIHMGCFIETGAIAYINTKPKKEAIIENEFLRLHFPIRKESWYSLQTIFVKEMDLKLPVTALHVLIGRPFPNESSEFLSKETPFEIIQKENGVALKQEFFSEIEKPGLKVVRWIEMDAGKKYVTTYYDLINTNTDEKQILTNVSIRYLFWRELAFVGDITIPGKHGFIVIDDTEFIDDYDCPHKPDDFKEPWFACEPHNAQKIGFGVIWDPTEVDRIVSTFSWGPEIDTIAYDLQPGQIVRTGHYTFVIGQPAARLTRNIWLKEFNGKAILNREKEFTMWSRNLMNFNIGQEFNSHNLKYDLFPSISFVDLDKELVEFRAQSCAKRRTSLDLEVVLSSDLWSESQEFKLELEDGKEIKKLLPITEKKDTSEPYVIPIRGEIALPLNIRNQHWIGVPYHSKNAIKLEKSEDYWVFSNALLNFKTSNSHGASLFSANLGDKEELFFSRFPNKESFVWFKCFVGGFHPLVGVPGVRENKEFFHNIWTKPHLVEEDDWTGSRFSLHSAKNDFRLKDISYTMTYYTKPRSPLIWGSLSFTNNSKMTNSIGAGLTLYLQPIKFIYHPWNNDFFIGKQSSQQRWVNTIEPDNWVIVDWGKTKLKALFASANPGIRVQGEYTNSNNYSQLYSNGSFTLAPGETKELNAILMFSRNLEDLKTFQQRQQVVRL